MKTKVVFVTKHMIMGGVERSLISLLENIQKDKFDVTVLVMGTYGELLNQVPSGIKVKCLFGNEKTALEKIQKYSRKGKFITAFKTGLYTYLLKRGAKSRYHENIYYSKMLPTEDTEYDLAIAYYIPTSLPVVYVMKNINAKKKIAWIHSDVTEFKRWLPNYKRFYEKYDHIFGVSNYAVGKFSEMFPHLKEKTTLFNNILDKRKIELLSIKDKSYRDEFDGIRILTVGRIAPEKGYDLIPNTLSRLLSEGYNLRWYCIGDGDMRAKLENMISEYGLEKNMILLGTKDNSYPYIKDCDIYIQPSRHESYCITIAEARIFNKPIITTDTAASEQIVHGKTGLVIDFEEQQMYAAIKRLLNNEALRNEFKKNLSMEIVDTTKEVKKLYKIIEKTN